MATLQGQTIAGSYKDLLQVSNSNSGIDATDRAVEDGEGTATVLYLSTTEVYSPGAGGNTGNTIYGKDAFNTSTNNASDYNTLIGELAAGTGAVAGAINNTGLGYKALNALTSGDYNVAIGDHALLSNQSGELNTAVGTHALRVNTASNNTAVGGNALYANVGGENNVAVGHNALDANISGNLNTAIGTAALGVFIGSASVAIGREALRSLNHASAADGTVAVGTGAGASLTSGAANVAVGYQALDAEDVGNYSTAVGYQALTTQATTHADPVTNTNSGNTAVGFKAGFAVSTGIQNTIVGRTAGLAINSGSNNTMMGAEAGKSLTDGDENVIIGDGAGQTTTSVHDAVIIGRGAAQNGNITDAANGAVAVGYEALEALTSGAANVAIGYQAGLVIDDGSNNTMIGYQVGLDSAGGGNNVYLGYQAAANATEAGQNVVIGYLAGSGGNGGTAWLGDYNVIIGHDSGKFLTGDVSNHNTFLGFESGKFVTTGRFNTAVGSLAMSGITSAKTTGEKNTCLGFQAGELIRGAAEGNTCIGAYAGEDLTTGSNNIIIGHESEQSSASGDNAIVMGHNISGASNTFVFGKSGNLATSTTFTSSGSCTFAFSSDERRKRNIQDNTTGLDLINKLQTKTFQWKPAEEFPKEWKSWSYEDGNKVYDDIDTNKKMHGFIAQEVKEVMEEFGVNDSLEVWAENESTGEQRVHEGKLIVPLIKAVQELSQQIEDLKKQINK